MPELPVGDRQPPPPPPPQEILDPPLTPLNGTQFFTHYTDDKTISNIRNKLQYIHILRKMHQKSQCYSYNESCCIGQYHGHFEVEVIPESNCKCLDFYHEASGRPSTECSLCVTIAVSVMLA